MEQDVTQYVDTLFSNLKDFSQQDGLIGKPVVQGDKTFLPVMSMMLGFGGGDSQSKGKQNAQTNGGIGSMMGGAHGAGLKLCTDAIIIIDNDQVSVTPIGMGAAGTGLMDKIPQIISGMKTGGQQGNQQQQGQSQQGQQSQSGQQSQQDQSSPQSSQY